MEADPIRTILLTALALSAALAALPADAAATRTVAVFSNGYADSATGLPVTSVAVGTTVTWVWQAGLHSVTRGVENLVADPADGFSSGERDFDLGAKPFSVTFGAPGDHPYYCTRHAGMRGLVHVE